VNLFSSRKQLSIIIKKDRSDSDIVRGEEAAFSNADSAPSAQAHLSLT
jgi:hypothetical protein